MIKIVLDDGWLQRTFPNHIALRILDLIPDYSLPSDDCFQLFSTPEPGYSMSGLSALCMTLACMSAERRP